MNTFVLKVINNRHKKTNGLYFENGSFNFLVDSQQLEYQKDKSILHMLKV